MMSPTPRSRYVPLRFPSESPLNAGLIQKGLKTQHARRRQIKREYTVSVSHFAIHVLTSFTRSSPEVQTSTRTLRQ